MVKIWVELELSTQQALEQILRSGGVRTLRCGKEDVFKLQDLKEGARYTSGEPAEQTAKSRRRPKGSLSRTASTKKLKISPDTVRGPLLQRAAQQRAELRNAQHPAAVRGPYKDTAYLNVTGQFRAISINKYDLQRRIDRWMSKFEEMEARLDEGEELVARAESAVSTVEEKYQASLRQVKTLKERVATLKADLQASILEDADEEKEWQTPKSTILTLSCV